VAEISANGPATAGEQAVSKHPVEKKSSSLNGRDAALRRPRMDSTIKF
jgi:hypothetical protein